MHRILALFALAACAPDAIEPIAGPDQPTSSERTLGAASFERSETIELDLIVRGTDGDRIAEGLICGAHACAYVIDGDATLTLPADTEVELYVGSGPDVTRVPITTPAFTPQQELEIRVVGRGWLASLERSFGVDQDPEMAVVVVRLDGQALSPTMREADGPFYLDARGHVAPGAHGVGAEGGTAVFFNVLPGSADIDLPGCTEGSAHWGPADDQRIEIDAKAGWIVDLPTVVCD